MHGADMRAVESLDFGRLTWWAETVALVLREAQRGR